MSSLMIRALDAYYSRSTTGLEKAKIRLIEHLSKTLSETVAMEDIWHDQVSDTANVQVNGLTFFTFVMARDTVQSCQWEFPKNPDGLFMAPCETNWMFEGGKTIGTHSTPYEPIAIKSAADLGAYLAELIDAGEGWENWPEYDEAYRHWEGPGAPVTRANDAAEQGYKDMEAMKLPEGHAHARAGTPPTPKTTAKPRAGKPQG